MSCTAESINLINNIAAKVGGGTINHDKKALGLHQIDYQAWVKLTEYAGAGDIDVKIQHSPDNGTTWIDLVSFTALSANGNEVKNITSKVFPLVRGVVTSAAGITAGKVLLKLFNNRYK